MAGSTSGHHPGRCGEPAQQRVGKRPVGASTITQQVAKNFLLTNEVSYERKIKEALSRCASSRPIPRTRYSSST
jgi:hypothetical protein